MRKWSLFLLSMDAYFFGTWRTPDDAYVFGMGGAIEHTSGYMMQLKKPLDFVAVADHGMYLGMMAELARENSPYADHWMAPLLRNATDAEGSGKAMGGFVKHVLARRSETADPMAVR